MSIKDKKLGPAPEPLRTWQDYALHGREAEAIRIIRMVEGLDLKTAAKRVLTYRNTGGRVVL